MARINGIISTGSLFKSINLTSQIYGETQGSDSMEVFSIAGPHGAWQAYTFNDIINAEYKEAKIGEEFGPTWTTHWFRLKFTIPATWRGKEVHFRWDSGSEACLYKEDGTLIQGISPDFRKEYILTRNFDGTTQPGTLYVEMACNHMGGAGDEIRPPNPNLRWRLGTVDIAVFNRDKYNLLNDLEILYQTANKLGDGSHVGMQAMFAANEIVNLMRLGDETTASTVAAKFFADKTGEKAHQIYAMGNCHIDTAWMWPYDETIRKCARSFSAQLRLMEEYPDFNFVCSQAQQYAWVKQWYPKLYDEMKAMITAGRYFL